VSSSQNNSNEEPNIVPASEQNQLPANTPQPLLENEEANSPETPPLILQTEPPMEVHHHGHVHQKKKLKEYFFEFFMLFLAVFCGFLAENEREHYVERLRAKEYAVMLVEDLAADTVEILDVMKEDRIILDCIDSISSVIQKGIKNPVPGSFYYYSQIASFSPTVVWNHATLTQITQTGSLRYFKNKEMVAKLSYYFSLSDFISGLVAGDSRAREENIKIRNKVLKNDAYALYSSYSIAQWLQLPDSLLKIAWPLQTYNTELLNEYANSFESRKRAVHLLLDRNLPKALITAKELISILKKEYHL
jgi:hypothetical protein